MEISNPRWANFDWKLTFLLTSSTCEKMYFEPLKDFASTNYDKTNLIYELYTVRSFERCIFF